jgi:hypothetical protein
VPETPTHARGDGNALAAAFLHELNGSLHELSQPMTVLLCTLEYGAALDSLQEMRETMMISQEACERLRRAVVAMQSQVRQAMETERRGGSSEGPTGNE